MTILLLCLFVTIMQRGTAPSEATEKGNNQPHIVIFHSEEEGSELPQQYFISVEQQLILECSSLESAVFLCIASHYFLNLEYHPKGKDVWLFIQEKVLQLPTKSRKGTKAYLSPSTSAHFSGITRFFEQMHGEENELDSDMDKSD